jgi:putative flippase GtrA
VAARSFRRRAHLSEMLRFGGVGLMTNTIDYSIFTVLILAFGAMATYAHIASYCTAAIFSFLANRHWTFRATGSSLGYQLAMFIAANLVGLAGSAWLVGRFSAALSPWGAKLLATVILTLWFYGFSRLVIFKRAMGAVSPINK